MIGGYILMFLYVSLLLGNLNLVEGRFYLAIVGLLGRYSVLSFVWWHLAVALYRVDHLVG